MKNLNPIKKPILIAEISCNHNGKFQNAKKLIKLAKDSGADFVKLQTYTPDTMTIKSNKKNFKIKNGLWKGKNLWSLYNKAQTPFEWQEPLFKYAKKVGIKCFSTPFDESAVNLLEKIGCPFYKISSFEMNDIPLIKRVAKTNKIMIISTGTSNLNEINRAYYTAKKNGAKKIILLYCVSNYPANLEDFNLNNIKVLQKKFKCQVGLSDHSRDPIVATTALSLGAMIFEKHIALDKQKTGFDIEFSLKGKEIRRFRNLLDKTWKLIGEKSFIRKQSENNGKFFRRSIYVTKNIKKGEKFTKDNIRRIRPGDGLNPFYFDKIIGKRSKKFLKEGSPFKKSFF